MMIITTTAGELKARHSDREAQRVWYAYIAGRGTTWCVTALPAYLLVQASEMLLVLGSADVSGVGVPTQSWG
jgi:hypothetical protein